jgi:hypothetical protein
MEGSFGDVSLKRVVGYKISAAWTPNNGFQSYFYVYVWDMENAQTPFAQAVNVGEVGVPKRGTLVLDGHERHYEFKNIDLMSAQVGATRRYRYRLLEFRYDEAVVADGDTPINLENTGTDKTAEGGLKDSYKYALDDDSEHLLGFRYRPIATGANVVRFSTLRNSKNCFLKKMIAANNEKNKKQPLTEFDIQFSQGNIKVTQQNLLNMYVDESFGYMVDERQPPLSSLTDGAAANMLAAVTCGIEDFTQRELLTLDSKPDPNPRELDPRTVETATFVFKQGNHQNLNIK